MENQSLVDIMTGQPYRITHLAGSARSGADKAGQLAHVVINGVALCGVQPRRKSAGWSEYDDQRVTCPKCTIILTPRLEDLHIGQKCSWLHVPAGGWGYGVPVDAVITSLGEVRAQIEVMKNTGELVRRWVSVDHLRTFPGKER